MHPLTHPLPVTGHAPLLDDNYLTPARASANGTTRFADQDLESVQRASGRDKLQS